MIKPIGAELRAQDDHCVHKMRAQDDLKHRIARASIDWSFNANTSQYYRPQENNRYYSHYDSAQRTSLMRQSSTGSHDSNGSPESEHFQGYVEPLVEFNKLAPNGHNFEVCPKLKSHECPYMT